MGFAHINTEVFYKGKIKDGHVVCNDATSEDKYCSNQYIADVLVSDHISYYDIDFTAIILTCQ